MAHLEQSIFCYDIKKKIGTCVWKEGLKKFFFFLNKWGFSLHFFFWQCQSSENVKWLSSQKSFEPFPFKVFHLCKKYLAFSWEDIRSKMSNYIWRANFHLETLSVKIFPLHSLGREKFSSWITFFVYFLNWGQPLEL